MPDGSNFTQSSNSSSIGCQKATVRRAPRAPGAEADPSLEARRQWKAAEAALNNAPDDDDQLEAAYHEAQDAYVDCRVTTHEGVLGKLLMIDEVENLDGHLERMPNLLWPRTLKALIRDLQRLDGLRAASQPDVTTEPPSPLRLIDQLVNAMRPMIDPETYTVTTDTPTMVLAIAPFIGRATIADAILLRAMLESADHAGIYSGPVDYLKLATIEQVRRLLDDFIICAEASGPACVRARGQYARRDNWITCIPDRAFLLIQSMAGDAFDAAHNTWNGDLFDGTPVNPDSVFEPTPWWNARQALLDSRS